MTPWKHQLEIADQGYKVLQDNAILYLAMEERTGKSLTALLIAEMAAVIKVLIITKKKALPGWLELLTEYEPNKFYLATNYHQICKLDSTDWDLIIIDEAHNYISAFPTKSKIWNSIRPITRDKPIIYLSATPHAQTPAQLYHQLALSDWSPWANCSNYKAWHRIYGIPYTKYLYQREVPMWDRVEDEMVMARVKHLFITKTRKELGFEHEPKDKLHYVPLEDTTIELYNTILKDKIYLAGDTEIVCDVVAKLRTSLHMLEGGVAKSELMILNRNGDPVAKPTYHVLTNNEKVSYIKEHWGDSEDIAIMYNYIAEGVKLHDKFRKARILQATSYAEGVDLHKVQHLIIYSQDFSTARHTQRRARQANLFREHPITVHFLLVKKGISEEVYNTVSINKVNYVDSLFERTEL